jgi:hypothetical protein
MIAKWHMCYVVYNSLLGIELLYNVRFKGVIDSMVSIVNC